MWAPELVWTRRRTEIPVAYHEAAIPTKLRHKMKSAHTHTHTHTHTHVWQEFWFRFNIRFVVTYSTVHRDLSLTSYLLSYGLEVTATRSAPLQTTPEKLDWPPRMLASSASTELAPLTLKSRDKRTCCWIWGSDGGDYVLDVRERPDVSEEHIASIFRVEE
jgi:hypothetical protein